MNNLDYGYKCKYFSLQYPKTEAAEGNWRVQIFSTSDQQSQFQGGKKIFKRKIFRIDFNLFFTNCKLMEISPLIDEDFERATKYVKAAPSGSFTPTEEQQLNLYSYFKQATIGPSKPEEKPAFYDMVGNAKHSAWSKLGIFLI